LNQQLLKKRWNESDLFMVFINLVPVWGVWFKGWDPHLVFLVYCLESVIVGLYNVLRLLLTTWVKKQDTWENNGGVSQQSGLLFVFFFMVHYGFFIFVQMSIFFSFMPVQKVTGGADGFFDFLMHLRRYLPPAYLWLLLGFVVSYGFLTLKNYVLNDRYKTASMGIVMFEPYPRIFVQQFAVILGGFFMMFNAGKVFILVFALVKIFFEVMVDFEGILNKTMTAAKVKSSQ